MFLKFPVLFIFFFIPICNCRGIGRSTINNLCRRTCYSLLHCYIHNTQNRRFYSLFFQFDSSIVCHFFSLYLYSLKVFQQSVSILSVLYSTDNYYFKRRIYCVFEFQDRYIIYTVLYCCTKLNSLISYVLFTYPYIHSRVNIRRVIEKNNKISS